MAQVSGIGGQGSTKKPAQSGLAPSISMEPTNLTQSPYSPFEEAPREREWHDFRGEMRSIATDWSLFERGRVLVAPREGLQFSERMHGLHQTDAHK